MSPVETSKLYKSVHQFKNSLLKITLVFSSSPNKTQRIHGKNGIFTILLASLYGKLVGKYTIFSMGIRHGSQEISHLGLQGHVQGQPGGGKAPHEIMGT